MWNKSNFLLEIAVIEKPTHLHVNYIWSNMNCLSLIDNSHFIDLGILDLLPCLAISKC